MSSSRIVLQNSSTFLKGFLFAKTPSRTCSKIIKGCEKKEDCWKCSKAVPCIDQFFCGECSSIQPVGSTNLFEYIGMPVKFDIKDQELKKRFRDLQFKLHPDKFAQASEKEKILSDEHSRLLNEAMNTLSEPLNRAKYLLEVLGGDTVKENEMDPDVLMEILEWQETVAEMEGADNLKAERSNVQKEIDSTLSVLESHFSEKDLDAVKQDIVRLSYLYSIRNSINTKIERTFAA